MCIRDRQQTEMIVKSLGMTMDQYMEQLRAIPAFAMACNSFVTLAMGCLLYTSYLRLAGEGSNIHLAHDRYLHFYLH